jgi:dihydropteroate synthase
MADGGGTARSGAARERALPPTVIGGSVFRWGERTYVMAILNVTPDSFSGDGLAKAGDDPVARAVELGRRAVADGADLIDVGGESTRPGHTTVAEDEELARVVPVIAALHAALPDVPLSVDTTKPAVADAAVTAGASLINDVWGAGDDDSMSRLAASRGVPIVLMHNRAEARYAGVVAEVVADLRAAVEKALAAGVARDAILVDPGFGFGKTADHNLVLMRDLADVTALGRPVLLGTSRKSTLGRVLDLPVNERLEATLATTALAIAAGVDMVRVHDVRANVRAARMTDAIVRARRAADGTAEGGRS